MPRSSWGPATGLVIAGWLAAAAALLWCLLTADREARLLAGIAALGLAAAALAGTLARPRLVVDGTGLTVRGPTGARHWPWPRVGRLAVVHSRRLGRVVAALELDVTAEDGSEHLVVLGRLDLGADVEEVAAVLETLRARPCSAD